MNLESDGFLIVSISDDTALEIIDYARYGFSVQKIASILGLDIKKTLLDYEDPESQFRKLYDKGKLLSEAKILKYLTDQAEGGNMMAITEKRKIESQIEYQRIKNKVLGGKFSG